MWHSSTGRRRILIAGARTYAALVAERDALKRELAETRRSGDEARGLLADLCSAVDRRQGAEQKVANLQRERDLARAIAHAPSRIVHCYL